MDGWLADLVSKYNYWIYVVLMMIGFYAMIRKNNLVKKLIGMNIFQTAIILFYISMGAKRGGGIPIVDKAAGLAGAIRASDIVNPLPHVLMLTAIVVSVSVTGVALAVMLKIYKGYGSIDEDQILERIKKS
ncbi:MAG: cation:proton antiporter subunit C [Deltaproteobacteria bacterium]|nr:cation:proton antiporter subunit C [Deltaproteobacteria bacterium]